MTAGEEARNRTFAALEQEVVLRDDGRYLIYFSLPGPEAEGTRAGRAVTGAPAQQNWAPDREPDV